MKRFQKLKERFNKLEKKKKWYVIAFIAIFVVMLTASVYTSIITGNFNRAQVKNGDEQHVNAVGIIITETKNGTKYFEIYGETGNYTNKEGIAILYNVVGNFYKNNEVSMSFQSSKGTYDEKQGIITLYDNTYIVLKDETSLEANKLVWSGSDHDVIAEGNVRIRKGNDMIATANKCIIGANYDKFKIIGKTQTQIFGKDDKEKQ